MSSEVKQLIFVAEGTAALGPYWKTIVSDYLEKIIRSFCGSGLNEERNHVSNVELSLVTFNCHGSCCGCLVQRSGWTSDVDIFLHWLSSIQFSGGGFSDAATAEGLADALMMFAPPSSQAQPNNDLKRHCILITASNPHPLPKPVYLPKFHNAEQSECRLSDAETVASYFSRCCVSLSVVCPRQLPKIRALYNAGKFDPQSADLPIDNTLHLVLISENFVEARTALSHSAINLSQTQSPVEVDSTTVAPSLPATGQPPATVASDNGSILNQQPVSVGPVPTATVRVDPSTVSSTAGAPSVPHIRSVARPATQAIPTIQTSSTSPVSQEMVTKTDNLPDTSGQVGQQTQSGIQQVGGSNSSAINMQLSKPSKYVKFWEGNLTAQKQGELAVNVTRLEGYRSGSASNSLAENWPRDMRIVGRTSQDHMNNRKYFDRAHMIGFKAKSPDGFLRHIKDEKHCAVIELPSQTLLLSVSSKANLLIGMLLPGGMVVIKHIPNHQQQRQHQIQQQQQQEQQQEQQEQ